MPHGRTMATQSIGAAIGILSRSSRCQAFDNYCYTGASVFCKRSSVTPSWPEAVLRRLRCRAACQGPSRIRFVMSSFNSSQSRDIRHLERRRHTRSVEEVHESILRRVVDHRHALSWMILETRAVPDVYRTNRSFQTYALICPCHELPLPTQALCHCSRHTPAHTLPSLAIA